jgi:dGTPase
MMKDHGGFEHNRQGLRVVEYLERRYPDFPGLNLSWEVREAIVKHRTRYDQPMDEKTEDEYEKDKFPSLEAQIVEQADSIAYDAHDLDDGLAAGLISEEDLAHVELWKRMSREVAARFAAITEKERRVQTIRFLINSIVTALLENANKVLEQKKIRTLEDVRNCDGMIVHFEAETNEMKGALESFLHENVYKHYRVRRMMIKAKTFVERLFQEYVKNEGEQLPPDYKERKEEDGLERVVCDYIAGMTDRYALNEYSNLFYPYERKGFFC